MTAKIVHIQSVQLVLVHLEKLKRIALCIYCWVLEGWKRLENVAMRLTDENGGVLELIVGVNSDGDIALTSVNLLMPAANWFIAWSCERATLLFLCDLVTNVFSFLASLTTLSAHVSVVFFLFLMFSEKVSASFSCSSEKALSYAMSSPSLFSLLNSSANEVSKGPEETPLIPPFVSDKTGFDMIDHSESSLHSYILFLSLKFVVIFCL